MPAQEAALFAFVKFFLTIPSLIFDVVYAMGPVIAPVVGLLLCCAWPFIGLRDKKGA
jgi:hypothetical protein